MYKLFSFIQDVPFSGNFLQIQKLKDGEKKVAITESWQKEHSTVVILQLNAQKDLWYVLSF